MRPRTRKRPVRETASVGQVFNLPGHTGKLKTCPTSLPVAASTRERPVRETASGGKILCQIHGNRFHFGVVPVYANLCDRQRQGHQKPAGAPGSEWSLTAVSA